MGMWVSKDPKAGRRDEADEEEKGSNKSTPDASPEKQPGRSDDAPEGGVGLAAMSPTVPGEATVDPATASGEANGGALDAHAATGDDDPVLVKTLVKFHFGEAYSLAGSPMTLKTNNVLEVHFAERDGVTFKAIRGGGFVLVNKAKYEFCKCRCKDKTIGGAHYLVVTVELRDEEVKVDQVPSGLALRTTVVFCLPESTDGVPVVASLHVDTIKPESMYDVDNYKIHSHSLYRLGDPTIAMPRKETNVLEWWCCLEPKTYREVLSLLTSLIPAAVIMPSYAYAAQDRINDFKLTTKIIQGIQVAFPLWIKLSEI